ncbi:unnamed protein product [Rotaria sp. Silwood2]|nr:unnamed protein product [Rotaria sp. Silwood2]
MRTSAKISSKSRSRTDKITTLEQLSPEIFFAMFDYLTATKFYRNFQRIFYVQNVVSAILDFDDVNLLERSFSSTDGRRLESISLLDLPLYTFQTKVPEILSIFKQQLVSLNINLMNMGFHGTGTQTAQSFEYLLTELPLLKYFVLNGSDEINTITYLDSSIINNTVISLTMSLTGYMQWISLLYGFGKLKVLTVDFRFQNQKKRVAPRDSSSYYETQIQATLSIDCSFRLCHVKIYQYNMILENVEQLFQLFISPILLTLSLFNCQRPFTSYPLPKRKSPFLHGTQWHDLMQKYSLSTMKRFYIEYEDVDNTMSMTNLVRVKNEFMKYSGQNLPWEIVCLYDQKTRLLSFDFIFT